MLALVLPSRSAGLARKAVDHNRPVDYNWAVVHTEEAVAVVDSHPEDILLRADLDLMDNSWHSLSFELNVLLLHKPTKLLLQSTTDSSLYLTSSLLPDA